LNRSFTAKAFDATGPDACEARRARELRAPYDGVLMFPKVPELWKVGSPIAFWARVQS
jgi:hypothetical protein